jgi:hypothetical protein
MKAGEALCPGHSDAPAAPQPSAPVVDRAGCHPDCGQDGPSYEASPHSSFSALGYKRVISNNIHYCSKACAVAKYPPLAAQPAEARKHISNCSMDTDHKGACRGSDEPAEKCQPAEQPKSAAKGPVCSVKLYPHNDAAPVIMRTWSKRLGPTPTCEPCFLSLEETAFKATVGTGKPYTGPERLPRPRLAHSMGIEDPTLPEAR